MALAMIPGSFDPVTYGHMGIIERAASQFDEVLVAVVEKPSKPRVLFPVDERVEMLREVVSSLGGVRVEPFNELLAAFAQRKGVNAIVKGLRAVSDFDYELQMAQMNYQLSGVETLFMPTAPEHSFLSSSLVREVAQFGGDVSSMVPPEVARRLKEQLSS